MTQAFFWRSVYERVMRFLLIVPVFIVVFIAFAVAPPIAKGQNYVPLSVNSFSVCSAKDGAVTPPLDWSGSSCEAVDGYAIDPQGKLIWVRALFDAPASLRAGSDPLGLVILAKASRHVWLNGVKLGEDGRPAARREDEIIGPLDSVHFIPPGTITAGNNEVAMLMSGHHGFIRLQYPFHGLVLAPYESPQAVQLKRYTASVAAVGAFIAAALFFLIRGVLRRDRLGSALLFAMALLASLQLYAEISRGLMDYDYPLQDIRLLTIAICGILLGYIIYVIVARRFLAQLTVPILIGPLAGLVPVVLFSPGFDAKTLYGMVVSVRCAFVLTVWHAVKGNGVAGRYAIALCAFIMGSILTGGYFLDRYFFFVLAGILSFLMAQQTIALRTAETEAREAAGQAARLSQALAAATAQAAPVTIPVKTGRRSESVPVSAIINIQGAGDYTEIHLGDGRRLLANLSLNALEKSLPANFLRVHRSHIVNTKEVASLVREPSGAGRLDLRNGHSVPVSRRILPRIRDAL